MLEMHVRSFRLCSCRKYKKKELKENTAVCICPYCKGVKPVYRDLSKEDKINILKWINDETEVIKKESE